MLDWLRRIFRKSDDDRRQEFFALVDALNQQAAGGKPERVERQLGELMLRSRTLVLFDPQYRPGIEISNFPADRVSISATFWQYPSGGATVAGLTIRAPHSGPADAPRKIGQLSIDSAMVVIADKLDIDQFWTETGKDRIGVISTSWDHALHRTLKQRFHLKTIQMNAIRAEVLGCLSERLEQEIAAYLKTVPRYAEFPFMHFHVQTNNSFDRVNYMDRSWGFLPVGNEDTPVMFACGTGRGDGTYDVNCEFVGDTPIRVTIPFIE